MRIWRLEIRKYVTNFENEIIVKFKRKTSEQKGILYR